MMEHNDFCKSRADKGHFFKQLHGKVIRHQKFAQFFPTFKTAEKFRVELYKFLVPYGFAK